ncbi:MAG: branched-chain amino acid ABC transporter permease [Anaerolineales bacterium]|jgi:branched-chain amino acid transport system permease protein
MLRTWRQRITLTDIFIWVIGLAIAAAVVWGTIKTLQLHLYTPSGWLDLTIRGLALGGVYALIAMGYTMVYGILKMINFAHSEVFMSGPFTAVYVAQGLSKSGFLDKQPVISMAIIAVVAMGVSAGIAMLLERIAYRPLRNAPRLVPLITAIGASFFLQYTFRGLFGSGSFGYPAIKALQQYWTVAGTHLYKTQAVVIAGAVVMMLVLFGIVQWTKIGKAMRAVSEDKEAAELMGIDVDKIIVFTFFLGGASAGAAGVLYTLLFPVVNFYMGFIPSIKAFTAAVLGGIGNVPGAFLGAIILGLLESVGPNLFLTGLGIPSPSQLKDAIAFVVLVFILIFRPTGLLGERISKDKA